MVALFASLKWRLLTSRLRAATPGKRAMTIVGLIVLGLLAVLIAVSLASLRTSDGALTAASIVLAGQTLAWVLSPLIAFGLDETVDPHRFALLPLRRATLIRGLTVSAVVGWLPMFNVVLLLGIAVMISPTWGMLPVSLGCVAAQLLLLIACSRAAATSLADLMSTRRGRDLGMLVGFGVFVAYIALSAALNSLSKESSNLSGDQEAGAALSAAGTVLGWTPPGAVARIPSAWADGDWSAVGLLSALVLATIGLGYLWWSAALRRSMESGSSMTESSSPAGTHDFGGADAGTSRVVVARDLLLVRRDPMRRLPWLMVVVVALGMPFIWVQGHGALFAVAFGALMAGTQVGNQFGVDGSAIWLHLTAIGDRARAKAEMIGHLTTVLVPGGALVSAGVVMFALVRGDLQWLPAGLGLGWSCLLGAAGMASLLSATRPYALPQARASMFASAAPQHKTRAFGVSMSILFGGLGLALPALACAALAIFHQAWWGWVSLTGGVALTGWLCSLMVRKAATVYFEQAPEIFAEVKVGDRS